VSRNEPASASVVVKLHSGRTMGQGEINSIVHLVSSSVAGLAPDRVALVSTEGTVLHKPRHPGDDANSGSDDEHASQTRSLEATLEERARQLVEKMVGQGHVDVRVSAELDQSRVERVEDRYDPKTSVVRSEERTTERAPEDTNVTGVPGTESNLPGGAGRSVDGGAAPAPTGRESVTRNFELDHIVEKRFVAAGTLRRITVAVVVDGLPSSNQPRSREEMEKISALVRSAVGADDKRGDVVTVESMTFLPVEHEVIAPPAPSVLSGFDMKKHWRYAAGAAGAALLGVIVLALLVRRAFKKRAAAKAVAVAAAAAEKATAEAATKASLAVSEATDEDVAQLAGEDLRRMVNESVARDPATAALILRAWLGESAAVRSEAA